jgi:Purple acid Phosphatase, N-terminal domain
VNKLLLTLSIAAFGGLLCAGPTLAQVTMKAGPSLEIAHDGIVILQWVTNNPGGADDHLAVALYGLSPDALTETATSPIRLNAGHADTRFRVRLTGLKPGTTYYYKVTTMGKDGKSDLWESDVNQFVTPAAGQRIVNGPLQNN